MRKEKTKDVSQMAYAMVQAIADDNVPKMADGKDPLAVALGRRGGLKGGIARRNSMTAEQRSESARKAAVSRWKNRRTNGN